MPGPHITWTREQPNDGFREWPQDLGARHKGTRPRGLLQLRFELAVYRGLLPLRARRPGSRLPTARALAAVHIYRNRVAARHPHPCLWYCAGAEGGKHEAQATTPRLGRSGHLGPNSERSMALRPTAATTHRRMAKGPDHGNDAAIPRHIARHSVDRNIADGIQTKRTTRVMTKTDALDKNTSIQSMRLERATLTIFGLLRIHATRMPTYRGP